MSVLFIIPAYKNPEQLEKCVEAVKGLNSLGGTIPFDYMIVDNNTKNVGFTKAINEGLRSAIGSEWDFAVALNQDCYLASDFLIKVTEFMYANTGCAIAGIKQISSENPDTIICGGCLDAYPFGKHITGSISRDDCSVNKQMPWVNGACMIFRVSALVEFGLMDEKHFLIGSDSDICYRARYAGYQVWYIAGASCVHEQGVSSAIGNEKTERVKYLDMVHFRNKWFGTDVFKELSMEIFD